MYGRNKNERDKRLEETLQKLNDCGLTLTGEKCKFRMHTIIFFGHNLTDQGINISEEKAAAVVNAQQTKSSPEPLSVLCLVQYTSKFLPNFSQIAVPLWKLTK